MLDGYRYGYRFFIVHVKAHDVWKDIAKDFEKWFDTSSYELEKLLPNGRKNGNVVGFMRDKLGGKIMKEFVQLKAKTYNYLTDNNNESKKAKYTKKCHKKKI